jgi:hypothetical protein
MKKAGYKNVLSSLGWALTQIKREGKWGAALPLSFYFYPGAFPFGEFIYFESSHRDSRARTSTFYSCLDSRKLGNLDFARECYYSFGPDDTNQGQ